MPVSPLETAGAAIQPTSAAPLHTNEFFTGLWTNGSPLGPGAVPFLYQRFYSAMRYDRLIDGSNVEVSTRLTLIRRPGSSVYNSQLFPPINRFYEWRGFSGANETIRIMASVDNPATGQPGGGTVRDVTGPSTNLTVQNKSASAGRTSFVSVGNHLYWGDGAETGMLVQFQLQWAASTQFNPGNMIVDSNGNVQMAMGSQTANVKFIQVGAVSGTGPVKHLVTLFFDSSTPVKLVNGVVLTMAGLTTVPSENGTQTPITVQSSTIVNYTVLVLGGLPPITPYSAETGTASTGTGISGSAPPTWQTAYGAITQDGGNQWVNMGPAAQPWGGAGPTTAPIVTSMTAPSIYPRWSASTWYAPEYVIVDSNNNLQRLNDPGGTTGSAAPTWLTAVGAVTADNTCNWTCKGPGNWIASNAYNVGDVLLQTFTIYITVTTGRYVNGQWVPVTQTVPISVTNLFVCMTAGTSGTTVPAWNSGVGTTTNDGTVIWQNQGQAPTWGASQKISTAAKVLDSNGYLEIPQSPGESGTTEPTWTTGGTGVTTKDNSVTWLNAGPYAPAGTGAWRWAYSGKNSVTGAVSTASPLSAPFTTPVNSLPVIQGQGLANPPWDTIVLWRTEQGGSQLMYDDQFPNPGPGQTWIYTDTNADASSSSAAQPGQLNPFILAPVAGNNNPPPANFVPLAYYLNRIWGYAGNILMWSNGPDQGTVAGSGDMGFTSLHQFTLPSLGVVLWPTSIGLIAWTNSDIWVVLGQGTYNIDGSPISPFYVVNFQQAIGILSADAFDVNGSTAYAMISSHQVLSIDPGAGEVEVGFPIGDLFDDFFDPASAYLAWHQGRSKDTALYVADGQSYWYRMAAVAAPESGNVWSPAAVISAPGKVKAIKSVETSPGIKAMLIGPSVNNQPILFRDLSTNQDAGVPYVQTHAVLGSVVLAQPGMTAGVQFVVVEEKMIPGSKPVAVSLLFDEILHGSSLITPADFRLLRNNSADPPNLPRSKSVQANRWWAAQDPSTVIKCRHYQQDLAWAAENFPNELYTNTVYGRLPEKARK